MLRHFGQSLIFIKKECKQKGFVHLENEKQTLTKIQGHAKKKTDFVLDYNRKNSLIPNNTAKPKISHVHQSLGEIIVLVKCVLLTDKDRVLPAAE